MKFFSSGKDGGSKSTVTGFWFIEIKSLCSVVLLCFEKGTREVYHTHAFNALTWWLSGEVHEYHKDGSMKIWRPSLFPKYTPRSCFHKVYGQQRTYALSFRGPWSKTWLEYRPESQSIVRLAHGRKEII